MIALKLNLTRTNSIIMNGPAALKCIAIIQIQKTKKNWGKYLAAVHSFYAQCIVDTIYAVLMQEAICDP